MTIAAARLPLAILVGLQLTACRTANVDNAPPRVDVTSHSDGDTVREGDPVTLTGSVVDPDAFLTRALVTWEVAGEAACGPTVPDADGTTRCQAVFAPGGGEVTLVARDAFGGEGSATVALEVQPDEAPSVTLERPDVLALYADVPIPLQGSVRDDEEAPEELTVAWDSDTPDASFLDASVAPDGIVRATASLPAGDHRVYLRVTDTDGGTGSAPMDLAVRPPNTAPTCAVTAAPASEVPGLPATFEASVADPDIPSEALSVSWSSDIDGTLGADPPTDGLASLTTDALSAGRHTISVLVSDELGLSCTAEVDTVIGHPPVLTISSPQAGAVYNLSATVPFSAVAKDAETEPPDLTLAWTSDVDGVLDVTPAGTTGLTAFELASLTAGPHRITLSATDGVGMQSSEQVDITINRLPEAPTVSILPAAPGTEDDLVAAASGAVDPDSADPVSIRWSWLEDGVVLPGQTGSTLPATATRKHRTYSAAAAASDAHGEGGAGQADRAVVNTDPALQQVQVSPLSVEVGERLTCSATASDVDTDDAPVVTYAWPDGSTGATYTVLNGKPGTLVTCTATADDGDGGSDTATAAAVVSNRDPVLGSITVTPGSGRVGDTLTCSATATDPDGGTPTITFGWSTGAAGADLVVTEAMDPGDVLTCTATAADAFGGSTTGTATAVVDNTDPVVSGIAIDPAVAYNDSTLTCSAQTSDDDGGSPVLTYAWSNTTAGTELGTGASLVLTADVAASQDVISCVAVASDDDGGTGSDQTEITLGNRVPTAPTVSIAPASPKTADGLVATAAGSVDPDGTTVQITWAWLEDNVSLAGQTSGTLPAAETTKGRTYRAVATPSDGIADGPTGHAERTVGNTAPLISEAALSDASPAMGDTITCSATATDADAEDTPSVTYAWSTGALGNSTTVSPPQGPGDTITCTATASDIDGGTDTSTASAVVENSDPVLGTVAVTPAAGRVGDLLTCSASATDMDGGTPAVTFDWSTGEAGASLLLTTAHSPGDTLTCTATATDAHGGSDTGSATATVENTLPLVGGTTITPSTAYNDSALACTATTSDADGDTPTLTYAWRNVTTAADLGAGATRILTSAEASPGDQIKCAVVATDAEGATATANGSTTLDNRAPVIASVPLSPAVVMTDDVLSVTAVVTEPDGQPMTFGYAWRVNGAIVQSGANTNLSGAAHFERGDTVTVTVAASDGTQTTTAHSATVVVVNAPPAAPVAAVSPADPEAGDALTCQITTPSVDPDGDAVSYVMTWTVDGALHGATTVTHSGDTVLGADVGYDEQWVCAASPQDATSIGTAATASATTPCQLGASSSCAADSCEEILAAGHAAGDDVYWLDPDAGVPFQTFCLMNTVYAGGGWTLLVHVDDTFDESALGVSGSVYDVLGTNAAYDRFPIAADLLIDAAQVTMTGEDFYQRSVIEGVTAGLVDGTLFDALNAGTPLFLEAEDNGNVTNHFTGAFSCADPPYGNHSTAACDTDVFTFGDPNSCYVGAEPFLLGNEHSYTLPHGNCCGFSTALCDDLVLPGLQVAHWPSRLRIFAR